METPEYMEEEKPRDLGCLITVISRKTKGQLSDTVLEGHISKKERT